MISQELQKKIDRAIRLLRQFDNPNEPIELSYSGGKDSDVILQLAKEAGIHYRAIYKSTTIDPPGTIKHAIENGAEVIRPQKTFFQLIEEHGMPSRVMRFCCGYLKEYKVLDKAIIGVRRAESVKRSKRYKEPTACRIFKNRGGKINTWSRFIRYLISRMMTFFSSFSIETSSCIRYTTEETEQ